jgi:hypothetical protein
MTCLIQDVATTLASDGSYRPLKRASVSAVPSALPLFTKQAGVFVILQNPAPVVVTDPAGNWALTLPWPSETSPAGVTWQIAEPDGTVWQGTVPEGIAGPLSLRTLQQSYAWAVVSAPGASALGITRLLQGASSLTLDTGGHLQAAGPAPSVTPTANAGSGASATLQSGSTDLWGKFTLTIGSSPSAGDLVTLAFATPFAVAPLVLAMRLTNGNFDRIIPNTATTSAATFRDPDTNPPPAGTSFVCQYLILGMG